jgi:signal transduction histidine kinase
MGATDDAVWWEIRDSGIGIPRAARARLFQKFSRAENAATVDTDGAGLGLYLVKLVVEGSGGCIDCESEEGRGATFRISLPSRGDEP